jgi:hypothetical protein
VACLLCIIACACSQQAAPSTAWTENDSLILPWSELVIGPSIGAAGRGSVYKGQWRVRERRHGLFWHGEVGRVGEVEGRYHKGIEAASASFAEQALVKAKYNVQALPRKRKEG